MLLRRTLLAALLGFGAALAEDASPDRLFQVSSALSARQVPAGGTFDLTAAFQLGEKVHLYKNRISFEWSELGGARQVAVELPKGKTAEDPFSTVPGTTTEVYEGAAKVVVRFEATGKPGGTVVLRGRVKFQGCSDETCFLPMKRPIEHELAIVAAAPALPRPSTATAAAPASAGRLSGAAFFWRILAAFGAGVLISFTPCVYPMIPITIAIIGGRRQRTKLHALLLSLAYVLGISVTYASLGLVVAALGGTVQSFLQSAWLRVPIAGVFVMLALGMFDVFTLQAPASMGGLADKVGGRATGLLGVFLLGAVSGVVVGPCVTPALFSILTYIATTGDRFLGFWLLFAVAWGMGLLLVVAGVSAGFLPKAGGWMAWVKKLMGFVILWGAAYFLAPFAGTGIFYLATAGLLLAGAVFLGCLDSLTPESGAGERAKRFLGLVAVFAAAAFFLGGFSDLMHVTWPTASGRGELRAGAATPAVASAFVPGDPETLEAALRSGRPVLLDFWASWCAVCKELDTHTYSDPAVVQALGRFRALKIDFDKHPDLVQRFGVLGLPTAVLFDSDGKERKDLSFVGFRSTEDVLRILGKVQ